MTPRQAKLVQAYLRSAADRLGLSHWSIEVEAAPLEEEGIEAQVEPGECQHATVRLPMSFFERPANEQRLVLAHELCHLHLARAAEVVMVASEDMHPAAFRVWARSYDQAEEQAVEAFARVLAPSLPLPRFG